MDLISNNNYLSKLSKAVCLCVHYHEEVYPYNNFICTLFVHYWPSYFHWQGLRSLMFCPSTTRITPSPSVSTSAWSGWSQDWTWAKMSGGAQSSLRASSRVIPLLSLTWNIVKTQRNTRESYNLAKCLS